MPPTIRQWVGEKPRGRGWNSGNDPFDVQTVQKLLQSAAVTLKNDALDPVTTDGVARTTVNGVAVPLLADAIKGFQRDVLKATKPDGRIDPNGKVWKALLKAAGEVDTNPTGWPTRPSFEPLTPARRDAIFTTFGSNYESTNDPKDPDGIRIKGTWVRDNIEFVEIPQLAIIKNPHSGRSMSKGFHKKSVHQFIGLWQSWEDAGLLDRVVTFDGAYVPRYMRNTGQTRLSNHSWGTAFDINAEWNQLNKTPAIIWEKGCVFELVNIAQHWGFYWGGHFSGKRVDGMHFEIGRLV